MSDFHRRSWRIEYREERASIHGTELRWLVSQDTLEDGATGEILTRGVIRHPGMCVIVPFLDEDAIVMQRQYRYSLAGELWEFPAGTLAGREEEGRVIAVESPAECAARELAEETGYRAGRLAEIGRAWVMPGMSDELMHVFTAHELAAGPRTPDLGELIREVRAFSRAELAGMAASGEIRDAKTLVALYLVFGQGR